MRWLLLLALLTAGGCSSTDRSASITGSATASRSTPSAITPTTPAPPPAQPVPTPDVAPVGALSRLRAVEDHFSKADPALAEGVRAVSALETTVRCWPPRGWRKLEKVMHWQPDTYAGLADLNADEIHLRRFACLWLHALISGQRPSEGDDARWAATSLVILAHEGTHLSSAGSNEALTECRAMQNADKVGAALGIDQDYAQRLSLLYWDDFYPRTDPVYGSPNCRNGGTLDLNPTEDLWP
jgi:hypothetical protein